MSAAQNTAGLATRSAPPQDRPAKPTPERIAEILAVVAILATYGRHLAQTLEHRAVARGFATIARFFGTVALDTILAHIYRGLMRTIALERMLRLRAARGRDLRSWRRAHRAAASSRRKTHRRPARQAASAAATDANAGAAMPLRRKPPPPRPRRGRLRRIAGSEPLTLDTLPSMEAIDAEVHRSPVGRSIAAICRDFGISPSLCDGAFWNRVFDAIRLYRGSLPSLVLEVNRRAQRFRKDEWRRPGMELPEETRDGIRRVLGFRIGEPPVDPFAVAAAPRGAHRRRGGGGAAAATGPP